MRTAPPVLPPNQEGIPEYKKTFLDRMGPDGIIRARAYAAGAVMTVVAWMGIVFEFNQLGIDFPGSFVLTIALAVLAGWLGARAVIGMSDAAGIAAQAFTLTSGNSTPYEQTFSYQEALAAKGDVTGALESYEAVIAEQPTAVSARMRAAEHYAKGNRDPKRAAELFKELRLIPGVVSRDALYATNRLVDLYDGPLGDPGRALVELRRIIEQYPGTQVANHARNALPAMKARLEASRHLSNGS